MAADIHNWVDALPTILLGLRSTIQTDTGFSAAQLTLGEEFRLPGDFFKKIEDQEAEEMILNIRKVANKFLVQPATHGTPPVFVAKSLKTYPHVFLQVEGIQTGFEKPYAGPFKVLERKEKTVKLKIFEKEKWVTWDRCKPAFMLSKDIYVPPLSNLHKNRNLNAYQDIGDDGNDDSDDNLAQEPIPGTSSQNFDQNLNTDRSNNTDQNLSSDHSQNSDLNSVSDQSHNTDQNLSPGRSQSTQLIDSPSQTVESPKSPSRIRFSENEEVINFSRDAAPTEVGTKRRIRDLTTEIAAEMAKLKQDQIANKNLKKENSRKYYAL